MNAKKYFINTVGSTFRKLKNYNKKTSKCITRHRYWSIIRMCHSNCLWREIWIWYMSFFANQIIHSNKL